MNILTKISVVLVVVLALFLSVVFVSYVSTSQDWKAKAGSKQLEAESYSTQAQNMALAAYRAQRNYEKAQDALNALRGESGKQITAKDEQIKAIQVDLLKAKADFDGLKARLDALGTNLTVAQGEAASKEKVIAEMRESLKKLNDESIAMAKMNNQLIGERDRSNVLNRSYQVTIQEQQEQIAKLIEQQNQPAPGKPGPAASEDAPKVDGTVTATKGNTASINIGSAKGIKKDMRLIVYRDSRNGVEVVGHLMVTDVDLTESAGIVDGAIRQGDLVTTSVK